MKPIRALIMKAVFTLAFIVFNLLATLFFLIYVALELARRLIRTFGSSTYDGN